jgi:RHS repeat-associated protein
MFFDNLVVQHYTGPLTEENVYYPFGLKMAGISSNAAGRLENKRKFNGIEQTTDLDINQYDAFFRTMDPQLGRWWQIDPKIDNMQAWSPYNSMFDNPIRYQDFLGDEPNPADLRGVKFDDKKPPRKPKVVVVPIPQKLFPKPFETMIKWLSQEFQKGNYAKLLLLHKYNSDKKVAEKKSREAKKGYPPAKSNNHLDEFPLKCTDEGGAGAAINEIPALDNIKHGGYIGNIVQANKMQTGDYFLFVPIPDIPIPGTETQKSTESNYEWVPGAIEKILQRFMPPIIVPPYMDPSPNIPTVITKGQN